VDAVSPKIAHAIDLLSDLSTPARRDEVATLFGPENPDGLLSGLELAWLNTASYSTAGATGAFGLMGYSEVRKYAEIYDRQALYGCAQNGAETELMTRICSAKAYARLLMSLPTLRTPSGSFALLRPDSWTCSGSHAS
jgi:hypothetical protein